MQVFALPFGHAYHLLVTLTPEQATAIAKTCCAVGSLILQYLSYRRLKNKKEC
jgi:hypothetical protein